MNLSVRNLYEQGLAAWLEGVLGDVGLPPSRLTLELTESSIVENEGAAIEFMNQLRALGCDVPPPPDDGGEVRVRGRGLAAGAAPRAPLDCGNSGTTARLMLGWLASRPFAAVLTGDASLRGRPMRRITEPLAQMGARFREGAIAQVDCSTAHVFRRREPGNVSSGVAGRGIAPAHAGQGGFTGRLRGALVG